MSPVLMVALARVRAIRRLAAELADAERKAAA